MEGMGGLTFQSLMVGRATSAPMGHSVLVAKRTLDVMQTQGQQLVQLIDQAGGLGRSIDVTA
jgi:hypothetical protein